jgi:hypothetical protein
MPKSLWAGTKRSVLLACLWAAIVPQLLFGADSQSAKSPPTDAELRQAIVGTWQDEYQGKRTMTVRADGTATMVVELHGWKAALYASRLTFEMVWSIQDGRLKKRTTGGEPSGKVNAILKMMGDRVDERILELTAEQLLLLDQNGKRKYDWHRLQKATSF